MDIEKAFDKVWHEDLLIQNCIKLSSTLPPTFEIVLENRTLFIKIQDSISDICNTETDVLQNNVLGPILYTLRHVGPGQGTLVARDTAPQPACHLLHGACYTQAGPEGIPSQVGGHMVLRLAA